jgi:hypothetical protein
MAEPTDHIWLQLATFAQGASHDADRLNVGEVIGRVDLETDDPDAPAEMPVFDYAVQFVVMLAAEDPPPDPVEVTLQFTGPAGTRAGHGTAAMNFGVLPRAVNLMGMTLRLSAEGRYWMSVEVGDRTLTRVPLDVAYRRASSTPATSSRTSSSSGRSAPPRTSGRRRRQPSRAQ